MQSKKITFYLIRALLYLFIVALIAVAGLIIYLRLTFNMGELKPMLERDLSTVSQRAVTIESLQWKWVPKPTLYGKNVRISDSNGDIYAIPELKAIIYLKALKYRKLRIGRLVLSNPTLTIKRSADGEINFVEMQRDISKHYAQSPNTAGLFSLSLHYIDVEHGTVHLFDEQRHPAALKPIIVLDGSITVPKSTGTCTAQFKGHFEVKGRHQGEFKGAATFPEPLSLSIEATQTKPELWVDYVPQISSWTGTADWHLSYIDKGGKTSWSIKTDLNNIGYPQWIYNLTVNGFVELAKDTPLTLKADLSSSHTFGHVTAEWPLQTSTINVTAQFDKLDGNEASDFITHLSSTQTMTSSTSTARMDQASSSWTVNASMILKNVHTDWADFDVIMSSLVYMNGNFELNPCTFIGLGGQGNNIIDIDTESFDWKWNLAGVDMSKLHHLLPPNTHITGRLHSVGEMTGSVHPFEWSSTRGFLELDLSSGTIAGLPTVVQVLTRLNLHSLFRTFEKNKEPGLPFDVIRTKMAVQDGVFVTSAPVVLHSDTLNIWSRGSMSAVDKKMNWDMVVQPLTLFDEVIKAIPIVKYMFSKGHRSLIPIYVKVTGVMGDPKIDIQSAKSLERTVWKTITGIFKLPATAVEDIFKKDKD